MRISDWSSDVCSSDLETLYSMDGDIAPVDDLAALARTEDAWLLIDEAHATGVFGPRGRGLAEIGRASCRERVCQYVSISVVAVTLKKKHVQRIEIDRA